MGHHKENNNERRDDRLEQEERRQEVRDETFGESEGGADNLGSQDDRRKDGDNSH